MSEITINGIEQPFIGSTFPKNDSDIDGLTLEPSMLMIPKITIEANDDELTSLNWLHDTNLLKNLNVPEEIAEQSKENLISADGSSPKLNNYLNKNSPSYVSYDPNVHVNSKPPYSFSCLIFMAIEHSENKALPVKDIYSWMLLNFPYFQRAPAGWKNSVRHNLSLNKCFRKVDKNMKPTNMVKGSYWSVDSQFRPNLLQAIRKSSYQPYSHVVMRSETESSQSDDQTQQSDDASSKQKSNAPCPDLFPFLSKKLKEAKAKKPEVDAATAMLAMKNGSNSINIKNMSDVRRKNIKWRERNRKRRRTPVITVSPSEDHTYSACSPKHECVEANCENNNNSHVLNINSTAAKVFENDTFSSSDKEDKSFTNDDLDLEEQKKIAEGADALLNLAGITTRRRKRRRISSNNRSNTKRVS